jgi:transcriptional regulator with XRE-family HTH domain
VKSTSHLAAGMSQSDSSESLLDERDVADRLNVSVATVRRWRLFKTGPKFLKIGAAVRYRPEDLAAFLDSLPTGGGPSTSTAQAG